jgi:molybdopterin/thiamine biosynthesis adenylyltransferase
MERRYIKNTKMLSESEMEKVGKSRVCVVGCGGIGGYVVEMLGRLGVGSITVIDGDAFDETNLNRQLFSDTELLGQPKADAAKKRMLLVNPLVSIESKVVRISDQNASHLLRGHDLVIDAVDSIDTRFILQKYASELRIPLIHGAIAGWFGQVTSIFPGDDSLDKLYPEKISKGIEGELGNPSFTPAIIASIQVSEALKILIGRGEVLRNKVLYVDMRENEYMIIELQ